MRKICFHNRKGGVGKSTLTGCCAYLASKHTKTVMVDADSQGNLTSWYVTGDYQYELADHLMNGIPLSEVIQEVDRDLYILPTSGETGLLKDYAEVRLFREPHAFDGVNRELERMGFDLVLYDLSPGMSQLERCVIASCEEVTVPVLGEYFSVDGIESALKEIEKINQGFNKQVRAGRLVVNMLNRSFRRHREAYEEYKKLDFDLFTIPQDAKIAESQYAHKPLPVFYPQSKCIPELKRLTVALMEG